MHIDEANERVNQPRLLLFLLQFRWFQVEVLQAMEKNVKLDEEYIDVSLHRVVFATRAQTDEHDMFSVVDPSVTRHNCVLLFLLLFCLVFVDRCCS